MPQAKSSLYPASRPQGSQVLLRCPGSQVSLFDKLLVYGSSLTIVGSLFWVPMFYAWAWKKFQQIPKTEIKRRTIYAAILLSLTALAAFGPHRHPKVGEWLNARKWKLWDAWFRFLAVEIIADQPITNMNLTTNQSMVSVVPHGIFPFSLAFVALPDLATNILGKLRPVVATATGIFPLVRDFLSWLRAVDASRPAVNRALAEGDRIGLAPGGIAEMFEGYPKHLTHPDDEYSIVGRGFFKMAIKHGVPVVPVYCFGSTKLFKRLQLPDFVETISRYLRASIVIFFGKWGLPIPLRQRLMYVIGQPILPPSIGEGTVSEAVLKQQVEEMRTKFCNELVRIFDRHKESYGWGHKSLITVSR